MNSRKIKNSLTAATAAALSAAFLAGPLGPASPAAGSETSGPQIVEALGTEAAEVFGEQTRLERGLKAAALRDRYDKVYERAEKLGVEPARKASEREIGAGRLAKALDRLRDRIADADQEEAAAPDVGSVASTGVSEATLASIAACESGGNPSAVDPSGTYRGKYQFDHGTWASVGGSGDPAAAPEAEQDYRAGLLYARSGAAPWPHCGR